MEKSFNHVNKVDEITVLAQTTNIISNNIDELVLKGIKHISENGIFIEDNPKQCQQAYDVHYTLTDPP